MEIFDNSLFIHGGDALPERPLYGSLLRDWSYGESGTGRAVRLQAGSRVRLFGHSETYKTYFYTPAHGGQADMLLSEDLYDISESEEGRVQTYRARYG